MAELPRLRVGLTLDSETFIRETNKVIDSVNKMGSRIEASNAASARSFATLTTATNALKSGIVSLLGAITVGTITHFAREALDAAGNLGELSTQAGVSVRELQKLQVAGLQVGISQEELVRSLAQFGIRVGDAAKGTGELAKTFFNYGISLKDSQGHMRSTVDLLFSLADAVKNAKSEQERLAIVSDAFGARIGAKLLPALKGGAAGFSELLSIAERAGLILGDEFVASADRASDALSTIQFAIGRGFQIGFVKEFSGSVSDSAEALNTAREAGEQFGQIVGQVFKGLAVAAEALVPVLAEIKREFELIGDVADAVKNAMAKFNLRDLSLGDINRQLGEVKDRLTELAGAREALAAAATEAGIAPENTLAIQQLNAEEDALRARRTELEKQQSVAQKAADASKALEVAIHGEVPTTNASRAAFVDLNKVVKASLELMKEAARDREKAAKEQLRFNQARIRSQMEEFSGIAEDVIRRGNAARFQERQTRERITQSLGDQIGLQKQLILLQGKETEQYRIQDRLLQLRRQNIDITPELRKQVEEFEHNVTVLEKFGRQQQAIGDLVLDSWKNAWTSIQNITADTFDQLFRGQITNFEEFAASIKDIFIRLAAEIATLLVFQPAATLGTQLLLGGAGATAGGGAIGASGLGGLGLLGTAGAAINQFGGNIGLARPGTAPGGVPVTILGAGGTTAQLTQLLGAGAIGGLGGAFVAPSLFGGGLPTAVGGGLGGAGGAGLGFALGAAGSVGGPLGAIFGGLLGGVGGGFIGSLFGGGGGTGRNATIGPAGLGTVSGTGKAAAFIRDFDSQLTDLLDERQRAIADRFLATAKGVSVKFQEDLSEADRARLAAGRIEPVARGLGFRNVADPFKSAEEQLERLAKAIDVKQQVGDLVNGFGQFAQQARALKASLDELKASAQEFGISTKGFGTAARRQGFALIRSELAQITGDAPSLNQQLAALNERLRGVREAAKIFGFDLSKVSEAAAEARHELRLQVLAQREAAAEQRRAVAEQRRAQIASLALGVSNSFKQLLDPLQSFLTSLRSANLNPLQQLEQARKDFARIANLARAGSTIAIGQLQGAGELFARLSEQVGASPGGVSARAEVASVIESVMRDIERAQQDAQKGLETEIRKASRAQIDTLDELIQVSRDTLTAIKKLQRS